MSEPTLNQVFAEPQLLLHMAPGPHDADWVPLAAAMSVREAICALLKELPGLPSLETAALGDPERFREIQRQYAARAVLLCAGKG